MTQREFIVRGELADRLLLVVYLIGLCTGAIVAVYGLAMLVDARLGDRPMGAAGVLIGSVTIAASWARISHWSKQRKKP